MEVRPHLARVAHIREHIYLNATNANLPMKEQQEWMYLYEQMLVDAAGEEVRFLPRRDDPPPTRSHHKEARRDQPDPRSVARPATVPIRE